MPADYIKIEPMATSFDWTAWRSEVEAAMASTTPEERAAAWPMIIEGIEKQGRLAELAIAENMATLEVQFNTLIDRLNAAEAATRVTGQTSDGYHTFDELYEHRFTLFLALCRSRDITAYSRRQVSPIWRSRLHSDGTSLPGWFVMGIGKEPGEQITYHLPDSRWTEADFLGVESTLERAPAFDGHTSADVLERLRRMYGGAR